MIEPNIKTAFWSLLLCLLSFSPLSVAQNATDLTQSVVEQRIASLKKAGAAETDEALVAYEQTRAALNQAQALDRETDTYVSALTTEPLRAAAIQERLDSLDATYDPAIELSGLNQDALAEALTTTRAQRSDYNARLEVLDRRLAARETSANAARTRLIEIDRREDEIPEADAIVIVDANAQPSLSEATQWRNAAELKSLSAERKARQAQLSSQPARYSALSAERAELVGNLQRQAQLTRELETRMADSTQAVVDLSELGLTEEDPAYTIAAAIVEDDQVLKDERTALNNRLNEARRRNEQIATWSRSVEDRYATARRIVDFAGNSDTLGRVLLTYWEEIEDLSQATSNSSVSGEAGGTVINRIDHEEKLARMVSASGYVNDRLQESDISPANVSKATMDKLISLTQAHRDRMRDTIATESEYLQALADLDSGDKALKNQVSDYRDYLEGLVLWIPNHPPLWQLSLDSIPGEIVYITRTLGNTSYSITPQVILIVVIALLLWGLRRRLKAAQETSNRMIAQPRNDSIRHTLKALTTALLRALPIPLVFLAIAASIDPTPTSARTSLPVMFEASAFIILMFHVLQIISEPAGIGRVHFGWRATTMDRIHSEFTFLIRWWLPVLIIAVLTIRLTRAAGDEIIGRASLLFALLLISYHIGRHQIIELRAAGRIWFKDTLNRIRALLSLIFLAAIVAIVYGQVFSVSMIIWCLVLTLWLVVSLLLIHSVLIRWSRVARRHLRLNELLALRAEAADGEDKSEIEEQVPDLGDISSETQQLITSATFVAGGVGLIYIWAPLLPALEGFSRITLWNSTKVVDGALVASAITLTTLITAVALIAFTVFAAKRVPALVEMILRSRTSISPGARYTTSTLLNYIIIGTGLIAGLSSLGLQWDKLQWLVAALGVGIGFGLQEIVANFISGLIILFERPIRVGDVITIGDQSGKVLKIRIRATTIRDWDGKELLVPNKEFITGRLLNWTLSDSHTRLVIPVGIAYGSNVEKALQLLTEVVVGEPGVLKEPSATFFFLGFGDNSLNLEARCFIASVDDRLPVLSSLHTHINNAFNDAGIVIAFPQRDLHFDSDQPLRIAFEPKDP